MYNTALLAAILAGTTLALPQPSQPKQPTAIKRSYPTPASNPIYPTSTPTPGYYSGGTYSNDAVLDTLQPETAMETALVDYICSAYFEYEDGEVSPYEDRKGKRQDDGSDGEGEDKDGENEDGEDDESEVGFAESPMEELLVKVLCSNYGAYSQAYYDDAEDGSSRRAVRARSARATTRRGKMMSRSVGRK